MALSPSDLERFRDSLIEARLGGVREVRDQNGEAVVYKSDAEMAAALRDVERRIVDFGRSAPPSTIIFATSKGL
jgi:hypothetical protein